MDKTMEKVEESHRQKVIVEAIIEYIEELTDEAHTIAHSYKMHSILRNSEERDINYLTGLLPVVQYPQSLSPSIYWVYRRYKERYSGKPIETHLKGACKNNRTSPRRYPIKYLAKYAHSEREILEVQQCEASLDPIRRKIFFLAKAAQSLRRSFIQNSDYEDTTLSEEY